MLLRLSWKLCVVYHKGLFLGPLLFVLYINDLNSVTNALQSIMFADDTNFFITGTNCEQIETLINTELELVAQWLRSNLLSLNLLKTAYMVFTKQKVRHMNLLLQSSIISQVSEAKFLGVIINEELSWSPHIIQVCNKISKNVGVIAKARHLLPQDDVCLLYHSLVEPYLNYCCMVGGPQMKNRASWTKFSKSKKSTAD